MTTPTAASTTIETAVHEFIARRDRMSHPAGSFDKAGRWYPSSTEHCDCCDSVRGPSRAYPYSYMTHCRTMAHVANLHGASLSELRKEVRRLEPLPQPRREGGEYYYKAVAVTEDGRLVSIFDGETEYRLGEELHQATHQDHNGGYYVYTSIEDARFVTVPLESEARHLSRLVIRVQAAGTYCRYANGKLAFGRITPLEIVSEEFNHVVMRQMI